jgi:hypothetical protein
MPSENRILTYQFLNAHCYIQLILTQFVTELMKEQNMYSYCMQDNTMALAAKFSNRQPRRAMWYMVDTQPTVAF